LRFESIVLKQGDSNVTHFGIICPPYAGHLNPQSVLGRELQARGHRVTVLQIPDLELKVRSEGLDFLPIGQSIYKPGYLAETFQQLARLSEIKALEYSVDSCRQIAEIICQDAPAAAAAAGIEALIVDRLEPVGETIAEFLNLPFVWVSCGQAIQRRPDAPPFFMPWSYQNTWPARLRNQVAYYFLDRSCQPILQAINRYRQQWKLLPYRHLYGGSDARHTHISQQPAAFDFPYPNLPENLHYVGPLRDRPPRSVSFPFERLTGQPLIYASLGSVQNTKQDVFRCIAEACQGLDVQLVIAHGGGMSEAAVRELPGSPLAVEYAPQLEVIAKASLTITHGGLNTVLDSLTYGVPLVAMPITFEQPGNGARIRWTGTGEVMPISKVSVSKLQAAIERVLAEESYRYNAKRIQQAIAQAGGVKRAADLIEGAMVSHGKFGLVSTSEITQKVA
jgi:MGT family glycosyltransferase